MAQMGRLIPLRPGATLLDFPAAAQSFRATLTGALRRHRLPESLIEALIREAEVQPDAAPEDGLAWALTQRIHACPIDFQKTRGVLLMGPDGAGKSAVAAKIAHIALLLGRRVEMSAAADGLSRLRNGSFDNDNLLVMETAGFNPANRRALSAFAALGEAEGVDSVAVISATSDAEDVSEIVAALRPPRVIVTGLDRTSRLGATVAAITGAARLAHVTYSARPDDALEALSPGLLAKMLLD